MVTLAFGLERRMDSVQIMTDFLYTADFMVPDPDAFTEMVVAKLGIVAREDYRQAFPEHGYIAHFLRVNTSRAVAPTLFEPQHHVDVPNPADPLFEPHLDSLYEFQGRYRPLVTHSCVIATDGIHELIDKLHRRRLKFRIAPIDEHLAWERVWTGTSPEQPRYTPEVDGGLCLEWHPIEPLRMPEKAFATPPPQPADPHPGAMIRIVSRAFLVRDLDHTLRCLSDNLDMEPAGTVERFDAEGYRLAQIAFPLANSACIDVIEPTEGGSETGMYLNTWGPGPYYVRIAVNGLDAKAHDLEARGTRHALVDDNSAPGGRRLRVDPRDVDGIVIDFVDWQ
jgi:hypothetical protein